MPCQRIKDGFICSANIYRFKGWIFEVPSYGSPWPLTVELMPRKRAGGVFWNVYDDFMKLSEDDRNDCTL